MREFGHRLDEIAGSLLVADPALLDPNFRRSVLLMASHDEENGSLGFVINRPLGKSVSELLSDEVEVGSLGVVPVLLGGPVAGDRLTFAAFKWEGARYECHPHLSAEDARELMGDPLQTVRAFAGYAGWSAGQLEHEIVHYSWLVKPADANLLEGEHDVALWREFMGELGPYFRIMAEAPDDPSLN